MEGTMKIRHWVGAGVIAMALAVPLAGCTSSQPAEPSAQSVEDTIQSEDVAQSSSEMEESAMITAQALEGTWKLVGASGAEGVVSDLPEGALIVNDDQSFSFSAQCNKFAGTLTIDEESVKTELGSDGVVSTLMLCDGAVGEVDDIAAAVLGDVQSATLTESGELTLVGPNGDALVFQRD